MLTVIKGYIAPAVVIGFLLSLRPVLKKNYLSKTQ